MLKTFDVNFVQNCQTGLSAADKFDLHETKTCS